MSNEYRRNFERQVRAAIPKYRSQASKESSLESVATDAMVKEADPLAVALDKNVSAPERVAALHALAPARRNDDEFLKPLFSLASDSSEPAELRLGVLRVIGQLRFSSARLKELRAYLIELLHSIARDSDGDLRIAAVEMLAQEKDPHVQKWLLDSLESGEPLAGSVEKTVQLLGYDIHANYFPLLQKIAREAAAPAARMEAVRLLAADADSAGLLREIYRDKKENERVRRGSASGYLSLDPAGFESDAKAVVLDDGDDEDVRAASLSALTHFAHPSVRDGALNDFVDQLQTSSTSESLTEAVRSYQRQRGRD